MLRLLAPSLTHSDVRFMLNSIQRYIDFYAIALEDAETCGTTAAPTEPPRPPANGPGCERCPIGECESEVVVTNDGNATHTRVQCIGYSDGVHCVAPTKDSISDEYAQTYFRYCNPVDAICRHYYRVAIDAECVDISARTTEPQTTSTTAKLTAPQTTTQKPSTTRDSETAGPATDTSLSCNVANGGENYNDHVQLHIGCVECVEH